ncbi:MAG: alpha/beta hydrolase [Candidatus Dojkabacteria bacterium]
MVFKKSSKLIIFMFKKLSTIDILIQIILFLNSTEVKEPLIILHGWGGSNKSLSSLGKELDKLFDIHLLEMPGHGETPEMDSPWQMRDFAEWLERYIKQKSLNNYHLLGHSFGGKIIFESICSGKVNPKTIILINANGIKPKQTLKVRLLKNASKNPFLKLLVKNDLIRKIFFKFIVREQDYFKAKSNVKESFKLFVEEHYDDKLSKLKVPTFIIWGKDDKVTPLWMGEKIHKAINNSTLVVLEGTHGLPIHKPKEVAQEIINFYKKI